ncbi:MAG: hypothetical protein KDA89_11165, partial [Planctomycetaceae bacterium]|nr:hypothetical protein [Planctomycetaceae bacterium]
RLPELDGTHYIGTGVQIGNIERLLNRSTEDSLLSNSALLGFVNTGLSVAEDIESLLAPGDSSIHQSLSEFFNNLESVANTPEVTTVRGELLNAADNLVYQFGRIDTAFEEQRQARIAEVTDAVDEVNGLIRDIAGYNEKIRVARAVNQEPNDLLDQRDQLLSRLTELADVSVQTINDGRELVLLGNGAVSISERPTELKVERTEDGRIAIFSDGSTTQELTLKTGRLGSLLTAVNETIPAAQERLQLLAAQVVRAIDQQHATGLTDQGGFDVLRSNRGADSVTRPLILSGLAFETQRGDVTISVEDPASGVRRSYRVHIDPYFDSLTDIAARFDALDGVAATVATDTGLLTLSGEGELKIDFAGRVDNVPDLTGFTGTGVPSFSGSYTGRENDEWTVTFNSAGTIGATAGLTATITNSDGQTVATLEVGTGYEAGQPLYIADGVSVQFESGTVSGTDSAVVPVTADADTSGLLSALGINSLFTGRDIRSFDLRSDVREDFSLLAISTSGFPGDAGNMSRLADLRDLRFDTLDDRTFIEELADFTADSGLDVQQYAGRKEQLDAYGARLEADREAVSGVNTDEELLHMLEAERALQAASRFITSVDESFSEIMRIIQ